MNHFAFNFRIKQKTKFWNLQILTKCYSKKARGKMQLESGEEQLSASFDKIRVTLDTELPEHTRSLVDNALNLEKVSQYCEDIYVNAREPDKQHLLAETKGYTTQALASVAYQIHVLANTFLQLFDTQAGVLDAMAESMAHLEHEVTINK